MRSSARSLPSRASADDPLPRWLARLRQRPVPVIPIIGARRLEQVRDNLASVDLRLDAPHMERLDSASAIELARIFHPPLQSVPEAIHKQTPVGFGSQAVSFRPEAHKTPYPHSLGRLSSPFSLRSTRSCRVVHRHAQNPFKRHSVQILERIAGGQVEHDAPGTYHHPRRHLEQLETDRPDLSLLQIRIS
jgi:hypothetical protein